MIKGMQRRVLVVRKCVTWYEVFHSNGLCNLGIKRVSKFHMSLLFEQCVQGIKVPVIVKPMFAWFVRASFGDFTITSRRRKIYSRVASHELFYGCLLFNFGEWRYFID